MQELDNKGGVYHYIKRGLQIAETPPIVDHKQVALGNRLLGFYQALVEEGYFDYEIDLDSIPYRAPRAEYYYRDDHIEHYPERGLLLVDGAPAKLRPFERTLLIMLTYPPNRIVYYSDMYQALWPDEDNELPPDVRVLSDRIKPHISRLRGVIEPEQAPAPPIYIKTVRRSGVLYTPPSEYSSEGVPPNPIGDRFFLQSLRQTSAQGGGNTPDSKLVPQSWNGNRTVLGGFLARMVESSR